MSESPLTIQQNLARASELDQISDSARLDVELLLAECVERERTYLYTWPEKELTPEQQARFESLFSRRLTGEPVAHILGQREFWSLPLQVNPSTLIPRPDTERLVEVVLDLDLPNDARVVDLGTGTGAIALALASEKPGWNITGVDQSVDAVKLAEANRQALGFNHITIKQSDWFGELASEQFNLIVSNPPYIDQQDPHLAEGDVRFEPLSALVADANGLADIQHIAEQAKQHLLPGGWLALEHGFEQGEDVREIFSACGYVDVVTEQDYGGNDRVTLGRYS
ncbi:peptide chain release factor N(5)-glutamine methyltransferase [Maricurvus nonylphenolicus]|uniref:peptide chain release factor N(5)-glutamine methyltransferase n=1 Tax=Maricurvus nonylphenolicus TaxID=1008307 RepID=UPI0036F2EDF4